MLLAVAASANPLPETVPGLPRGASAVGIDVTPGLPGPGTGGYQSRVIQPVYQTNDTAPDFLGAGSLYTLEDVRFSPGPWAAPQARSITNILWKFQCAGWTAGPLFPQTNTPTASFDTVFEFWNAGSFTLSPNMLAPQTAPFAVRIIRTTVGNDFTWDVSVTLTVPVAIPADNCWVGIKYVNIGTYGTTGPGTRLYDGSAGSSNPAGENALAQLVNPRVDGTLPNLVGLTTNSLGRERSGDNIFLGGTAGGAPAEHFSYGTVLSLQFQGDAAPPPPTPNFTRCGPDLADGLTTQSDTLVGDADRVRWHRICTSGGATDAALTYLDIDTETSATSVAIAVFSASGNRLACDSGLDGSAGNSQISFGVGRRAEFASGGQQYDGRCGELLASTGTGNGYYIAVAPQGSSFGSGFLVNVNTAAPLGSYALRLRTNVNGAAVGNSVPPLINGTEYGLITTPSATPGFGVVSGLDPCSGLGGVVWSRFQLDQPATGNNYLDIDLSDLSANTDTVAYIFDNQGNELAFDDISGPLPDVAQFSFGADSPMRTYAPNPIPFEGNVPIGNAGLPAGTYYLAIALFPTQDLSATSGGRWHVRGTSGSNLTVGAHLYTGTVIPCGSADFDGDGDTGTDLDIEAFFACMGGNCCATCFSADFDGDGDTGTDLDIEAFFRVLGGGTC